MVEVATAAADRAIDLLSILNDLVADRYISQESANLVAGTTRTREQASLHPLAYIASQQLDNLQKPGKTLDELTLTHWIGAHAQNAMALGKGVGHHVGDGGHLDF